ncbi:MAG: hypothetical protein KDA52_10690 [Planctomycetaceae bacterium]|nr:hypothetical protein [Planctomycetaceae bacterium]
MMSRRFVTMLTVCVSQWWATSLPAQTVLGPEGPRNPEQKQPPNRIFHYELTVTPAAEPSPPLKYSLYPRWNELTPGNSVPMWYRALSRIQTSNTHFQAFGENQERWFTDPWDALPVDEIRSFLNIWSSDLENAQKATYREDTDWDLRLRDLRGPETIAILLEEFQNARQLAYVLALRIRLNLLERNYDAVLADMRICFRLAHDVAEPETLINDLIGMAIIANTEENIQHFIDTPGSPNLYWALAAMPSPMIDLRPAMQAEMSLPVRLFPWLKDPEAVDRTPAQWHQVLHDTMQQVAYYADELPGLNPSETGIDIALLALVARGYPTAKRQLIEAGHAPQDVEALAVGQVVGLHQQHVYQQMWQNFEAASILPYQQAQRRFDQLEQGLQRELECSEVIPMVSVLLPSVRHVSYAGMRREVSHAILMTIEAIRMHMAVNEGRLPASLDEISIVPVPNNPVTNVPFSYELKDDTALIDSPFPYYHQQYRISVDAN